MQGTASKPERAPKPPKPGGSDVPLFPIFTRLGGRRVLVAGGGAMATVRVRQLLAAGANVTVISPRFCEELRSLARSQRRRIELVRRELRRTDVTREFVIVVGATNDPVTQLVLADEAEKAGLLYNVVDAPDRCNYFTPAVVERGGLQIAICSSGQSPVLSGRMRQLLDQALPKETGEWVALLGELRERLKRAFPRDLKRRKELINEFIERVTQS